MCSSDLKGVAYACGILILVVLAAVALFLLFRAWVIGARMLDRLEMYHDEEMMKYAYEICRWHHERYDGKGYPDGLKGEEIPISAQVVSLADAYDALVSDRVYKKAYSHEKAMEMILNGECGMFNPLLLECLVEIQDKVRKELGIKGVNECLEYLEERNC